LTQRFIDDFHSNEARCDFIDMALRCSGMSQNETSVAVLKDLGISISQRNPMWFVIAKDHELSDVIDDVEQFLQSAARVIWRKSKGSFTEISPDDLYASRLNTYYAHRSVCMERLLLDALLSSYRKPRRQTRSSVLPKIANLPCKFRMYVTSTRLLFSPDNEMFFLVTISTPVAQHHKHKEFSGKLRAIRYDVENGSLIAPPCKYIAIVDGAWEPDQLMMLSKAGWHVYDWDAFFVEFGAQTPSLF
jgi:hypothetical protein